MNTTNKRTWKKSVFSEKSDQKTISEEVLPERHEIHKKIKQESSKKVRKAGSDCKAAGPTLGNWMDIFEPKNTDELALHPKKYGELQKWFMDCESAFSTVNKNNRNKSTNRICLISGPAGSGKTAAVRALATKYKFQLHEWVNPLDQDAVYVLGDQTASDTFVVPHLINFKSFLFHASRYKSLLDSLDKRLLLVEDFPNALLNDAKPFEEILSEYMDYGRSPLVFIVSDTKSRSLNISYNLFSDEVKQKFAITHISFNPIANTLMQKAMKRFNDLIQKTESTLTNYKTPTQNVIDSIILSAQGDIRNAMINFHFAALKGAPDILLTELTPKTSKTKGRTKKQTSLKSVGRDESVTMLHALGRVFNPKSTPEEHLVHSPEYIAESFSTEPKKFLDFIHANLLKHFSDIEHTVLAADSISNADILLQEYRASTLSTIGLNVATRGVMVANRKPVTSWLPVRGPKRITSDHSTLPGIPKNIYALDYGPILRLIAKRDMNKT